MELINRFTVSAVVLALFACLTFSKVLPEKCITPDEKPGSCLLLQQCPSLNNMSNDFETPMTMERLNFLINSQCRFKDGILTVCCSLEELEDSANVIE